MSVPATEPAPAGSELSAHRVHDVGSHHVPRIPTDDSGDSAVRIVDTATARVRQPWDLLSVLLSLMGITGLLFLAVFAHGTTEGVQSDVQAFSRLLARILFFPVAILEGLVTLVIPFMVVVELSLRRLFRQLVEALAAAGLGLALAVAAYLIIEQVAADSLIIGLSVLNDGQMQLTLPAYVAGIAGLLTVAGPRTRRRTVNWSWNLLWITLGVLLITAQVSLPGVAVTLLLGRTGGLVVRYLSGVRSERAYGPDLIAGVRRAGFEPQTLLRVRDVAGPAHLSDAVIDVDADGDVLQQLPVTTPGARGPSEPFDPSAVALMRSADNRVYAMTTEVGPRRDVVVLDGDRQVLGLIARAWRSLRLRGIEGRTAVSLRAVAERAALLMYAARAAGVRTPALLGMAESADSMLFVQSHAANTVSLRDMDPVDLTDAVLQDCWYQLKLAHADGLAHRGLTSDVVLVNVTTQKPEVWLTGWESGDIASSVLARRLDLSQMLALLALRVGAERAIASATAVLSENDIEAIGPLLQSIALPSSTREELRDHKPLLGELRTALVAQLPEADVEPAKIVRFGTRTIVTMTLGIVAVAVVLTSLNFEDVAAALSAAQPWWAAVCFLLGAATWVGAAIAFRAFSPVPIPLWRVILTQASASYVALTAPAGIGPAVLNLRLLTRRGVAMSLAGATVALVQVSQILVTVVLLVIMTVITGDGGLVRSLPSTSVLWGLGVLAVAIAGVLLVPQLRRWLGRMTMPLYRQTWPRLSQILSHPGRLAVGLLGNAGMTMAYVFAFDAALRAFGQDVSIMDVAVIYLVGNAAGAAVPTPGGIGAIEGVLAWSLAVTVGMPTAIAATVVILFRVMTYWGRIPFGWVAMKILARKNDW